MTDLPRGWRVAALGEVCSSFQYGWTSSAKQGNGLGLLRTTDLTHGPVKWSEVPECNEVPEDVDKYLVRPGDFFISRAGSVGVSAYVEDVPRDCVFASYLIRLQASNLLAKRFFKFFLLSPGYWTQVGVASAGIALQNINATKLKAMTLPLPPLAEQECIAELLEEQFSGLDSALTSIRTVREKAATFRRSLLRSLTCEATYCSETSSVDSVPLSDVGKWGGGGTPSKSNPGFWSDGTIPWVTSKDMKKTVLSGSEMYITLAAIEGSTARLVPENSVAVVARSGILEHTLPVALVPFASTFNQDLKVVTPTDDVSPKWLVYVLQANGQEILHACRKAGTTVASIEWPLFLRFEVPLPSVAEQNRLVAIIEEQLSRLDNALEVIDQLEARVASQRRSLLHAAFTGDITANWREAHV